MKLYLYRTDSEPNKVVKDLELVYDLEGTLLEATSVLNPSITIRTKSYSDIVCSVGEVANVGLFNTHDFISVNYAYIPEFKRYYFIDDIISIKTDLWSLTMRVDVLMSFSQEIKNLSCFVTRNEYTYNDLIRDDYMSYYYDKDVTEFIPVNGSKKNFTFKSKTDMLQNNYTISVINDVTSLSFDSVTSPSSLLPEVGAWDVGVNMSCKTYSSYPASVSNLFIRLLTTNSNLADGVMSVVAYPFVVPNDGLHDILRIKTTDLSGANPVEVNGLTHSLSDYYVIADFTITGNKFTDYEPYTQYEIYLPYLGWVGLSADVILNKRLLVIYTINYQSGSAQVSIIDDTSQKVVYTSTTQLGCVVPISSSNQYDVERNKLTNNISLALGLTSSAITTAVGVVTYNPVGVMGGVLSGVGSVANYINNSNSNYLKASGSVSSGLSGAYLPQEVRVRKTALKPRGYDDSFFKLHGKPLNQYRALSTLTGYTEVGNLHLDGFKESKAPELQEIESKLKTGVIL